MNRGAELPDSTGRRPFVHRHRRALATLAIWAAAIVGYQLYAWRSGLSPLEATRHLADLASSGAVGGLVFVAVFASSTLVLFPPTLLTVAAGFVFGPVEGALFAALGSNLAGSLSYLMGKHLFRGSDLSWMPSGLVGRCAGWMEENGFTSVLVLRLAYAPFDPVGLLAGFLRIDWARFALATMLGSFPCTLSLVLLGSSLETGLTGAAFRIDPRALLASAILLAGTLLLSYYLRRRNVRLKGAR